MYRCTECMREYTQCPDFCECGNDTFEEFLDDVYGGDYVYDEVPVRPAKKQQKLSPEEIAEIEEEKRDRQRTLIVVAISLCVSVIVLFLPPHMEKKTVRVKEQAKIANLKIPDVNSYWDNTLTYTSRKKDTYYTLPLLNKEFGQISPELKKYIAKVGNEFSRRWEPSMIQGSGECRVTFTIDKEGNLDQRYTRITERSHNESLDDSVLLLLSKLNSFDIPPRDYKGERVIIAFKKDVNGNSKVYYPTN